MNNIRAFDKAIQTVAVSLLRRQYRDEIERAIDRVKGVRRRPLDEWFRRAWYRAWARQGGRQTDREPWRGDPGVPLGAEWFAVRMRDELRMQGYEFDHGFRSGNGRSEVWVNRKSGRGIAIEWFRLPEAAR